ncbi:MAG: hypothetical protein M3Z03_02805 [Actinomycetota bacterium]|nr:hypothetical protein [Actinomycetota bacterium]
MAEPELTANDLRGLIPQRNALVILGNQRSGTNLLAKDIGALGTLGRPGEHLSRARRSGLDLRGQFEQFAADGGGPAGDTFAVTLMVNYLEHLGVWVAPTGPPAKGTPGRSDRLEDVAVRFFLERFEKVTFVTLDREPLWEWAYSHWRLTVTNQYHLEDGEVRYGSREVGWRDGDPVVPDPAGILEFMHQIQRKRERLERLLERNAIEPVALTYREVVDEFPTYLHRITRAAGLPDGDLTGLRRALTKLAPQHEVDEARQSLRHFLGL